jgi:hypothetical protein
MLTGPPPKFHGTRDILCRPVGTDWAQQYVALSVRERSGASGDRKNRVAGVVERALDGDLP